MVRPSLIVVLAVVVALFFFTSPVLLSNLAALEDSALKGVHLGQPTLEVTPSPLSGPKTTEILSCERVQISGQSRLNLRSYANARRVLVVPSVSTPEKWHSRIQVCFHRNASLGLCQCEKDDWKPISKGMWSSVMSPYENRFVDLKLTGEVSGPITVSIVEELQRWRLICLGLGILLFLLAPVVSTWVPFYYSSSMAIGVLLVVIILLFQGMKLLPTGRNKLYLTLFTSAFGAGSYLLHQLSMMVSTLLTNFGLSEEMHNPVYLFLLVGIIIAGAALGYWIVRKFVISEDGSVDVGVAQFVKWAMRLLAATLILQSTRDTLLACGALVLCFPISYLNYLPDWHEAAYESSSLSWSPSKQWSPRANRSLSRAEFLAKTPPKGSRSKLWNRQNKSTALLDSPVKGVVSPWAEAKINRQDYYSVHHKTPNRKKFSEQEWEDSKAHWTKQTVSDLFSAPDFADWAIDNADKIRFVSGDNSDETIGSDSDSTDDVTAQSSSRFSLFSFW